MINEKQKWPTDKKKYDKEYLRIYGEKCPKCVDGKVFGVGFQECDYCHGIGYIEKGKSK